VVSFAPWPLNPRERAPVPIGYKGGWVPKSVRTVCGGEICCACPDSSPGSSSSHHCHYVKTQVAPDGGMQDSTIFERRGGNAVPFKFLSPPEVRRQGQ
jgi:hypothetical protein